MEKLCFGTYATRLQKTLINNSNEDVTDLLIGLITDNTTILNRNGDVFVITSKIASELLSRKVDVLKKIRDASGTKAIINAACDYFEDVVIPAIMPDLIEDLLCDMQRLILADIDIPKRKQSEFISKSAVETLADFLSSVFLYAIKQPNRDKTIRLNMESNYEISSSVSVCGRSIPDSDLYLLMEVESMCPKCGKTLVNNKNGHSLSGYAITEIDPSNPFAKTGEGPMDLIKHPEVFDANNNLIVLCLDCSNRYKLKTTYDERSNMKQIKEKLRRNFDAAVMLDKMYLEEQIESVLRRIPIDSTDQINETLEYTALRVREKITSNVPLIIKTEGFVVQYYKFIKSIFAQMERECVIDFDNVASDVKRSYKKLLADGHTQEEIFAHLVSWFMKKTNTKSVLPCEIIVAFFIQNCEVFHAIPE